MGNDAAAAAADEGGGGAPAAAAAAAAVPRAVRAKGNDAPAAAAAAANSPTARAQTSSGAAGRKRPRQAERTGAAPQLPGEAVDHDDREVVGPFALAARGPPSRFRGVRCFVPGEWWQAHIEIDAHFIPLGYYRSEAAAARAVNEGLARRCLPEAHAVAARADHAVVEARATAAPAIADPGSRFKDVTPESGGDASAPADRQQLQGMLDRAKAAYERELAAAEREEMDWAY